MRRKVASRSPGARGSLAGLSWFLPPPCRRASPSEPVLWRRLPRQRLGLEEGAAEGASRSEPPLPGERRRMFMKHLALYSDRERVMQTEALSQPSKSRLVKSIWKDGVGLWSGLHCELPSPRVEVGRPESLAACWFSSDH